MRKKLVPDGVLCSVVLLLLVIPLLAGCSQGPPPAEPIADDSSALGISLKMRQGPLRLTSKTPEVVLFVRLEEGESISDIATQDRLIASNLADGDQLYLLNIPPGTYVAVAAIYGVERESMEVPVASTNVGSNVSVGVSLDIFGGEDTYRNYLSEELIEQTRIVVKPASFAFMGKFTTNQSTTFGDGDKAQSRFIQVLEGRTGGSGLIGDLFSSDHSRRLSAHDGGRDEEASAKFFKKARKHLKETGWLALIDKATAP